VLNLLQFVAGDRPGEVGILDLTKAITAEADPGVFRSQAAGSSPLGSANKINDLIVRPKSIFKKYSICGPFLGATS
jgi:hypothetical protein